MSIHRLCRLRPTGGRMKGSRPLIPAMRQLFLSIVFLYSFVSANAQYVFFTFDPPGSVTTTVQGINNSGQLVGNFSDAAGSHAFLRIGAAYTTFAVPGASQTFAAGINNVGQITGQYTDATGAHGYIRSTDGMFTSFDVAAAP